MMDDGKLLHDALGIVKAQSVSMKRSLDTDQIMDALKSASTMLAELRTSSLSPKQYYELYMSVFDALRHLTTYLYDAHNTGKHHLADLYELVQYAGNIVPRLYLMITVGSVYMSIPDAPVKEIMKDMLEMTRGVQHATRGLFLRHYLSGQTRDYLPLGRSEGPDGNLQDSIAFVLTNFVEMNKLWVRLQHHGPSKEREKRETERKDLRILVGTNLVRLSQLDGVDLELYRQAILPSILEQVVGCKDVIAQEYLMEVVIQVFTDELHLHTLDSFLSATAQLHPKVNVKQIVISLIDRLAAFAARESENETSEERRRGEEEAAQRLATKIQSIRGRESSENDASIPGSSSQANQVTEEQISPGQSDGSAFVPERDSADDSSLQTEKQTSLTTTLTFRGIPTNVRLFEIFWQQVVQLILLRPDLAIQDITALLVSLLNLALSCYPDRLDYVDHLLLFARQKIEEFKTNPDLFSSQTTNNLLSLLLAPVASYASMLTLLAIPSYKGLLEQQPIGTRISIGQAIVASILKNATRIESALDVNGILELCKDLVMDLELHGRDNASHASSAHLDPIAMAEQQGWLARMIHLFVAKDPGVQFELMKVARQHLARGAQRIRYTYPALISASLRLARDSMISPTTEKEAIRDILKFTHQTILTLYTQVEPSDIGLRLCLSAAQMAGECQLEDLAYEFFVQAFVIYEESISESYAQVDAITEIISHLQSTRIFGADNYDTLITKAALHGSKLLKKPHQGVAVLSASHMWWQTEVPGCGDASGIVSRDGKRVLECLQKALRIASSCVDEASSIQLYVEALDSYVYYFEQAVNEVTPKYINSLTELITSNIDWAVSKSETAARSQVDRWRGNPNTAQHFKNTLAHMRYRQQTEVESSWREVELAVAMQKMGMS